MRFSKKYIVCALLIVLTLFGKFNSWHDRYSAVETFRGANLKDEVFYPLMSKNINDMKAMHLNINGKAFENNNEKFIIDASMQPAVSLDFVRDDLRGSVYRKNELSIILHNANDEYEFLIGNETATQNGDDYVLCAVPSEYNGQIYLGLEDVCKIYGFGYVYNEQKKVAEITVKDYPKLPAKFDLRKADKVSVVRNQGSDATCWACASLEAMESTLRPLIKDEFSVDAMIKENSFGLEEDLGGDYTMALAYLLSWQGPKVKNSKNVLAELTTNQEKNAIHLQEAQFFTAEDLDGIKSAVYRYGGVSTSIYASATTSNLSGSNCYNRRTNSYCYMGNHKPNHDIVIVGWDDNYPADNFGDDVTSDGAFICQNSWGKNFGENGIFYISYYDTNIGKQAVSYTKIDTLNKYSSIYQSDLCGWVGQIGYHKQWAYGANVFKASENQMVEATGFYALEPQTSYQVYFVPDYKNVGSFGERKLVAKGTLDAAGYYTIPFSTAQDVSLGKEFAVIVYLNSPETLRPLAIEYPDKKLKSNADISDGKGYISNNGLDWERVEDVAKANLCIKAYANKKVEVLE